MSESKVQLAFGAKGGYKEDIFVHGNYSIAHAYFTGLKLLPGTKVRLLDKDGNIIAIRKNHS